VNRIALNIICKNEAHIIERMLTSALPMIDMIVAVDTGSTDDTVALTNAFGMKHNLPTFVFDRPFDNFCNSRNHALDKLHEMVALLNWNPECTWGFNADCDEIVRILPGFNKQVIECDMLVLRQRIGKETFTRQGIFRLSKNFRWESPVHEELVWDDPSVKKKYEFNIEIIEEPAGASWKGNLEQKFLRYAHILKEHIASGNRNFRSIYFVGDSYNAAASYATDERKAADYYQLAEQYFDEAATLLPVSREVRFMLYKKIAENKGAMGYEWPDIKEALLAAYNAHVFKAETLAVIIEHYLQSNEPLSAYMYSKYAYLLFTKQYDEKATLLYVDEALYQWKLLFLHYRSTIAAGKKAEGHALFKILKNLQITHPEYFSDEDRLLINIHSPLALRITRFRTRVTQFFKKALISANERKVEKPEPVAVPRKSVHEGSSSGILTTVDHRTCK